MPHHYTGGEGMSEQAESYKYTPPIMEESWGYKFTMESRRFIYLTGRMPKEAFVSSSEIERMQRYIDQFLSAKDDSMAKMDDGSYGTYEGVIIYSTSKPGITFA